MRILPNVRFGTERYPERVARRLRALNIATWIAASVLVCFTVVRLLDPVPGRWGIAASTAATAVAFAFVPLLHRFSPLAAPLAFIAIGFAALFRANTLVGTAGGSYFFYLTAAPLAILFLGTERTALAAAVSVLAAGLIIGQQIVVPADTGFLPPTVLFFVNFVTNVVASTAILFAIVHYAVRQITLAEAEAEREYTRSESLLANILPPRVAAQLKERAGSEIAEAYPEASILFADMAGFTERASDTAPVELVRFLNAVFTRLDAIVESHGLEKIKTTGDAYMVVSGVPERRSDHAVALAALALDMRDALAGLVDAKGRSVPVRIGIASGPVVAGVVGTRKFFYDVWGDAVNVASRMESTGEVGKIQVSPQAYRLLREEFDLQPRGETDIRGKGPMATWFLLGRKVGAATY